MLRRASGPQAFVAMSEYQSYEFATIDGPISDEGLRYARGCSSLPVRWQNTGSDDFDGSVNVLRYSWERTTNNNKASGQSAGGSKCPVAFLLAGALSPLSGRTHVARHERFGRFSRAGVGSGK